MAILASAQPQRQVKTSRHGIEARGITHTAEDISRGTACAEALQIKKAGRQACTKMRVMFHVSDEGLLDNQLKECSKEIDSVKMESP